MYPSVADANQYLRESVILLKKTPIKVIKAHHGTRGINLTVRTLRHQRDMEVRLDSPDLDFKPVPTGYGSNQRGNVFYLRRLPVRAYKQGLHNNNIFFDPRCEGRALIGIPEWEVAIADMIQGRYKSLDEALKEGGPFHRHFQIVNREGDTLLQYKGVNIGRMEEKVVDLYKEYFYLDRVVEEVFDGCG